MELALHIANLGSGALMVLAILLQRRSAGIGSGVGGTDAAYTATGGIDRLLVRSTVVLALIFFGSALGMLFV